MSSLQILDDHNKPINRLDKDKKGRAKSSHMRARKANDAYY
jgi:hypothetical protein